MLDPDLQDECEQVDINLTAAINLISKSKDPNVEDISTILTLVLHDLRRFKKKALSVSKAK